MSYKSFTPSSSLLSPFSFLLSHLSSSFGHMYTWLKKPKFHHLGLFEKEDEVPSTLNPLLPESFEFVCNLYASLLPHFSSDYVNIGLDEAFGLGRYQIEEYCREKGKAASPAAWM